MTLNNFHESEEFELSLIQLKLQRKKFNSSLTVVQERLYILYSHVPTLKYD